MASNFLSGLFDELHTSFTNMGSADDIGDVALSKTMRMESFRQAQEAIKKIDNAIGYAKGTGSGNFGFSTILQMSKLPPLVEDQAHSMKSSMDGVFSEMFATLDEDALEALFQGRFEELGISPQQSKSGLPALVEGEILSNVNLEQERELELGEDLSKLVGKVEKTFGRMGSEVQNEAETAYRQTYSWIAKANDVAVKSKNEGFQIGFSKILEASQFEARITADMKGISLSPQSEAGIGESVSTSKDIVLSPARTGRSFASLMLVNTQSQSSVVSPQEQATTISPDVSAQNLTQYSDKEISFGSGGKNLDVRAAFNRAASMESFGNNLGLSGGLSAAFNRVASKELPLDNEMSFTSYDR